MATPWSDAGAVTGPLAGQPQQPLIDWDAFQRRSRGGQTTRHLLTSRAIDGDALRQRYEGRLPLDDPRIIAALGGYDAISNPAVQGLVSAYLDARRGPNGSLAVDTTYDSPDTLVAGDDAALATLNDELATWLGSDEAQGYLTRIRAMGTEQGQPRTDQDDWVERLMAMTPERAAELNANADTRTGLLNRFNALWSGAEPQAFDETDIATRMQRGQFSLTPQWDGVGATGFLAHLDSIGRSDPAELERLVGIAERAQSGDQAAQDEWLQWTGATTGRMDPTLTLEDVRKYGTREQVTAFQRQQRAEAGMPTAEGPGLFDRTRDSWWQSRGGGAMSSIRDNGLGRTQAPPSSWINSTTEYNPDGSIAYSATRSDPFSAFTTWGTPRAATMAKLNEMAPSARGAFRSAAQAGRGGYQTSAGLQAANAGFGAAARGAGTTLEVQANPYLQTNPFSAFGPRR